MQKIIIADTSCLILLDKIGELSLLNELFGEIYITNEVAKEYQNVLPPWFIIQEPQDKNYQTILEANIDKGEASAIALALEYKDALLIIDDLKGRIYAQKLGLTITGTLGIIVDAKSAGIISSAKKILEKVKETNFRISPEIELQILKLVKED
jgi:predicted nucleic acid-binding protein